MKRRWVTLFSICGLVVGSMIFFRRASSPDGALVKGAQDSAVASELGPEPVAAEPAGVRASAVLDSVFPPSELPEVATEAGARVSLAYLAQNGADLSKPMPSKHRVFAANETVAAQWVAWAKQNEFEIRGPEMIRDHVGTPRQRFDLVRTEVPTPAQIEGEGRLVLEATRKIPGSYYQTWVGEIVR